MKHKVLKDFVDKKGNIHKPGQVIDLAGELSKFNQGLVDHGFLEVDSNGGDWDKHAIKSRLTNLLIAPEDYVAASGERHFTYEAALGIEGHRDDGWRLPTRSEWVLICEEFGQKGGRPDVDTLADNLKLNRNGVRFSDGHIACAGNYGIYWSSTPNSNSTNAYNLTFNGTSAVNPSSSDSRYFGFSVRLVKEAK